MYVRATESSGVITLTAGVTDLGGGSYIGAQWSICYGLSAPIEFVAAVGVVNCSPQDDRHGRTLLACLSTESNPIVSFGDKWRIRYRCVELGNVNFKLDASLPITFMARSSAMDIAPISITNASAECTAIAATRTPTSTPTPVPTPHNFAVMRMDADPLIPGIQEFVVRPVNDLIPIAIDITDLGDEPYSSYSWGFDFLTTALAFEAPLVEVGPAIGLNSCSYTTGPSPLDPLLSRMQSGCASLNATTSYAGTTTTFNVRCLTAGTFQLVLIPDLTYLRGASGTFPTTRSGVQVQCGSGLVPIVIYDSTPTPSATESASAVRRRCC
jgi:hypothetical protein